MFSLDKFENSKSNTLCVWFRIQTVFSVQTLLDQWMKNPVDLCKRLDSVDYCKKAKEKEERKGVV